MSSYNLAVLMGNLVRDPELKVLPSTTVCNFTLAVNERSKEKDTVSFVDIKAFGKTAENTAKYCRKGSGVLVSGRIKQETWEKDGQKRSKLVVIADSVTFVGKKSDAEAAPTETGTTSTDDSDGPVPF